MTTDNQIDHIEKEKFEKKLKWAKDFINFNIKAGVYDEEQFEGMKDYQLIEFVETEEARADMAYEAWKENK